jgi:hypothetical protein
VVVTGRARGGKNRLECGLTVPAVCRSASPGGGLSHTSADSSAVGAAAVAAASGRLAAGAVALDTAEPTTASAVTPTPPMRARALLPARVDRCGFRCGPGRPQGRQPRPPDRFEGVRSIRTATACSGRRASRYQKAPRTGLCQDWIRALRPGDAHRRQLVPLLWHHPQAGRLLCLRNRRINGDAALVGYCYNGRKVCVLYQTSVQCWGVDQRTRYSRPALSRESPGVVS